MRSTSWMRKHSTPPISTNGPSNSPLPLDERAIDDVLVNTHIIDVVVERELKFRIDHAAQAAAKGKVQNQEERLVEDPLATPMLSGTSA